MQPVACGLERFPDGELRPVVGQVRGTDVYVIQPTGPRVNEYLVELLLLLDACRRGGAHRLTARGTPCCSATDRPCVCRESGPSNSDPLVPGRRPDSGGPRVPRVQIGQLCLCHDELFAHAFDVIGQLPAHPSDLLEPPGHRPPRSVADQLRTIGTPAAECRQNRQDPSRVWSIVRSEDPGVLGMAVTWAPARRLKRLGRPEPRDDSPCSRSRASCPVGDAS
ncbi:MULTISPECIES: ribose-phosphate pyrophosphokinase-like domain-containing protein [Streptomyces]|uniref:ribose-phosphate pyrophosphokinase-like domain-containing protein n=1 Tax=Streptomyces TaxID=1883 RepID=UPI00369E91F6